MACPSPVSSLSTPPPELLAVLQHLVLPLLSARDLVAARRACSGLRVAIQGLTVSQWRSLLSGWLSPLTPVLQSADLNDTQRLLSSYYAASNSILSGQHSAKQELSGIARLSVSPDGTKAAVLPQSPDPHPGHLIFQLWDLKLQQRCGPDIHLMSSCSSSTYSPALRGAWLKLTWSADSSQLHILHTDSRARVYSFHSFCTTSGAQLASVEGIGQSSLASADGRYLAASSSQASEAHQVLDLQEACSPVLYTQQRLQFAWHPVRHSWLAFLEQHNGRSSLSIRDVCNGRAVMAAWPFSQLAGPICFSPNGKYLSVRCREVRGQIPALASTIQLIDTVTRRIVLTVPTIQFESGLFSPDSTRLVTEVSYKSHDINVWDIATQSLLCSFEVGKEHWPACWSPDSQFLCFTRASATESQDHTADAVRIYTADTGELVNAVPPAVCPGSCVRAEWYPDCTYLIIHTSNCLYRSTFSVVSFGAVAAPLQCL